MSVAAMLLRENLRETTLEREDYFQCFLADQPDYLVPERLAASDDARRGGNLTVSPNAWFMWREHPPEVVSRTYPLPARFLPSSGLIWVVDPIKGMQLPFWAGPWFQAQLSESRRGERPPKLVAPHVAALLGAGVIEREGDYAVRSLHWKRDTEKAVREFAKDGFAVVPSLIHPFHLGALRRYYRRLVRTGAMILGDNCSPQRWVAYQEEAARFFHLQIAGVVATITGVAVKPTFAYAASYLGNADLEAHRDRAQCEFAVSVLIDYVPEPVEQSPWPLQMETSNGWRKIWQSLGDAVLYRGTEILHRRDRLGSSAMSTSLIFYFVNQAFQGPLD